MTSDSSTTDNIEVPHIPDPPHSVAFSDEIDYDLLNSYNIPDNPRSPTASTLADTQTFQTESTLTVPSFELGVSTGRSADSIWSGRTSTRRSWIWRHRDKVEINGKTYWKCNLCTRNPQRYADGSTKHPIEHLKSHRMTKEGLYNAGPCDGRKIHLKAFV